MKKLFIVEHEGRGNYAHVTDGEGVAYVECNRFGGYNISTSHIPNIKTGTGFQLYEGIQLAKIESALREAMVLLAPNWASSTDRESTDKWPNAEAFLENQKKFWKDSKLIPFSIENLLKHCKHDGHYRAGFNCTICGAETFESIEKR